MHFVNGTSSADFSTFSLDVLGKPTKWSLPGDSKCPFHPLVGGHLTHWKGHLTIPKRSRLESPGRISLHKVRDPGSRLDHPQEQLESIEMNSTLVETWPAKTSGEGGQIPHPDFRYKVEISTDPVINGVFLT